MISPPDAIEANPAQDPLLLHRQSPDLVDNLLGQIGAGAHRLIFRAFDIHGRRAFAVDVDRDAAGLAFSTAFLALAFPFAFPFALPFPFAFKLSFVLAYTFALPFAFTLCFHLS